MILKKPLPEQPFIHKSDARASEVAQNSPSVQTAQQLAIKFPDRFKLFE
jgi:hypothetical protein